ncbi:MAG: hypothetical protein WDZ49_11825 [Litorilinea sp.]
MARRKKQSTRPPKQAAAHLTEADAQSAIELGTIALHNDDRNLPIIKVVGMSGAGKSTLVRRLRAAGYNARAVSQEHSAIQELWRQFDHPLILIYLTLSLEVQRSRRADVTWTPDYFRTEEARLGSARAHADVRIDTSNLTPDNVYDVAVSYLRAANVRHATVPLQPLPSTGSASRRGPLPTATDSQT